MAYERWGCHAVGQNTLLPASTAWDAQANMLTFRPELFPKEFSFVSCFPWCLPQGSQANSLYSVSASHWCCCAQAPQKGAHFGVLVLSPQWPSCGLGYSLINHQVSRVEGWLSIALTLPSVGLEMCFSGQDGGWLWQSRLARLIS